MHTWLMLRLVWLAAIVVYLVLTFIPCRPRGWERKIDNGLFVLVVVFVGTRVFTRVAFHGGSISDLALVFAGFAAAIGILFRIKALTARIAAEGGGGSR
jgi:hypothetical protein